MKACLRALVGVAILGTVAAPVLAQQKSSVTLYDKQSRTTGYATIDRNGSINLYSPGGQRLGYGQIRGGTVQVFTPDGQRTTTARPPGSAAPASKTPPRQR